MNTKLHLELFLYEFVIAIWHKKVMEKVLTMNK